MDLGQVFTSEQVANFMVSLIDQKDGLVLDPCFGRGAFLKACHKQSINNVVGYEIDKELYESTKQEFPNYSLVNDDFLSSSTNNKFDTVVMNPPYIRHENIDELISLDITKDKLRNNVLFETLPKTANMYMYFVVKALDVLKNEGTLIVIFPDSWINSLNGKKFRELVFSNNTLVQQYNVSGNVFEKNALVKVVVMKIKKGIVQTKAKAQNVMFFNNEIRFVYDDTTSYDLGFKTTFDSIARIKRGITTGYNKAFINPKINSSNCTKKIISSPKAISGYSTKNSIFDSLLYVSNITKADKETKIYCENWTSQIVLEKRPKTLYENILSGEDWFKLRLFDCSGIIFSYFVRNDIRFIDNSEGYLVRDNFYIIYPNIDQSLLFALLNNYYSFLQIEQNGKHYGAGLLKIQTYDIKNILFPDINDFSKEDINKLKKLSYQLIESNDFNIVRTITKLLSKYSFLSAEEVETAYFEMKTNRLKEDQYAI